MRPRTLLLALPLALLLTPALVVAQANTPAPAADDSAAQAKTSAPQAKTADVQVDPDVLKARLKPLQLDEMKVEVDGWVKLFQDKVKELTERDIARLTKDGDERQSAIDTIVQLRKQLTEIDERVRIVIAAWQKKGAKKEDVEKQEKYLAAAGGVDPGFDFEAIWALAYGWLTAQNGGIRLGINILLFLLTLLAFKILAKIAGGIVSKIIGRMPRASDLLKSFAINFASKFTFFLGLIVALTMLGVNVGPFLAVIGAAGFIIGFALQGTLNNFAAGIMILFYRPFDVGQVVEVAGVTGKVHAMTMSSTTVKTPDNQVILIPNGSIWGGIIKNVTGSKTRRVDLKFGIGYGDDIAKALRILEEVVAGHEKVLEEPKPVIKLSELGDSSVNFVVRPWAKTGDYWDVYWDLTRAVKERFDAEDVTIPFPQRDVHVHQVTG